MGASSSVKRRRVGGCLVQLADDVVRGMWWIVAVRMAPPRQVLVGFLRGRRGAATDVFEHVTEAALDRGEDSSQWR